MSLECNGVKLSLLLSFLLCPDDRGDKLNYSPHENDPAHSLNNLTKQVQKPTNLQELAHTVPPRSSMDNFATYQTEQHHGNSTGEFCFPLKIGAHPA